MRLLSHPLRLDAAGAIVTVDDGSRQLAGELAGIVLNTGTGERSLAPEYGITDPTASDVSATTLAAAVSRSEPELEVADITITTTASGTARVSVAVDWAQE